MMNKKFIGEILWIIVITIAVVNAYLVWSKYMDVNMYINMAIVIMAIIAGHLVHSKSDNSSVNMKHLNK